MNIERIIEIIAEQLGADVTEITTEASFREDLNADSLDLFQIIMALEEEFLIEIPTEDAETIQTVADAVNYIKAKTEK